MNLEFEFRNFAQKQFFELTTRNQCFSGGFQNGKSFVGCTKALSLLGTFPGYRFVIGRQVLTDLKKTTLQTFFKVCPREFIKSFDPQSGVMTFVNDSVVFWMHLDACDEQSLRGLEINSVLLDQAEEIAEQTYLVLDGRIGRWEKVQVPPYLLKNYLDTFGKEWPRTALNNYKLPTYMMILVNPDTQFHWVYRRYHPDSFERRPNHGFVHAEFDVNLGDPETYAEMLSRDPEWVAKYVHGTWGLSSAQIHQVHPESIIEPSETLLDRIKKRGALYRILDHGDTAPTACLWAAALDGYYIFYREYYLPNGLISQHRQNIFDLSAGESYVGNYADPAIFKSAPQKSTANNSGLKWTVADEYITRDIEAPPLAWLPADNNEIATRNRINELLSLSKNIKHPITEISPAPQIYFVKKNRDYPYGTEKAYIQTQSQRREKIGDDNGKAIYSDDREESIEDHAYDCVRYFVAQHGNPKRAPRAKPPKMSFAYYNYLSNRIRSNKPLI